MESTRGTTASVGSINGAVIAATARVLRVVANSSFEEAFTTLTCANTVVLTSGFIPANCAFDFLFRFRLGESNNWRRTCARCHVAAIYEMWPFKRRAKPNLLFGALGGSLVATPLSCLQDFFITYLLVQSLDR